MKISRISVYQVDLHLDAPSRLSGGKIFVDKLDSTIVSIETDNGLIGWGEECPWGNAYLPAFSSGVRAGIRELAPALLGQNPCQLDHINHVMDKALPGNPFVKSALDMACWDLLGKSAGLPLYTLLGGYFGSHVTLQTSIFTDTPARMVTALEQAHRKGYTVHSAKVGLEVDQDIERIHALLEVLRPGESLTLDANRAWLPDQAIAVMNSVLDARPYFEQPCETLEECRTVRRQTRQPIILDECVHSFSDLLQVQRDRTAEGIGLKIGRVGGLTKARRFRDFCVATGIRMNIESSGGSAFADAAAVHLATATPETHRRATWLCSDYHSVITGVGGFSRENGRAVPADVPGLGVEPRVEILGDPDAIYS